MTPEQKIKAKIKRRVEKLAKKAGLPLFWDTPPASQYGAGGRPDHTVMIGNYLFYIEAKAAKHRKCTAKQLAFHEKLRIHGYETFVVAGEEGVNQVFTMIKNHLIKELSVSAVADKLDDRKKLIVAAGELAKQPPPKSFNADINPLDYSDPRTR